MSSLVSPGDGTLEMLQKYKLESIYNLLCQLDLNKECLEKIDNDDLDNLIDILNLNLSEKIRFKKMIRELNSLYDNNTNNNATNNTSNYNNKQNNKNKRTPAGYSNHSLYQTQPRSANSSAYISNPTDDEPPSANNNHESKETCIENEFEIEKSRNNARNTDYTIKMVLIGEPGVGKTSMVYKFTYNTFNPKQQSTVGIDFATQVVYNSKDESIFLRIWDTAGQEKFDSMNCMYIRDADCIIIVYDITKYESFKCINDKYKTLINEICVKNPYIMLVGNKYDLKLDAIRKKQEREMVLVNKQRKRAVSATRSIFDDVGIDDDDDDETATHESDANGGNIWGVFYNNNNHNDNNGNNSGVGVGGRGEKEYRMVSKEDGSNLAGINRWGFKEVSAKSGYQLDSLFKACAEYSVRMMNNEYDEKDFDGWGVVRSDTFNGNEGMTKEEENKMNQSMRLLVNGNGNNNNNNKNKNGNRSGNESQRDNNNNKSGGGKQNNRNSNKHKQTDKGIDLEKTINDEKENTTPKSKCC